MVFLDGGATRFRFDGLDSLYETLTLHCLVTLEPLVPIVEGGPLFDKAALEIGYITIDWARLESAVSSLMVLLLRLKEESAEAHILDGNMDLREKIQATKGLIFLRHFDQEWMNTALALLDHIDNNLRPRRNTVVHSGWFTLRPRRLTARTRKTKIVRPQAFQLALETEQNVPMTVADLRRLRQDIQETWQGLLPIIFFMLSGDKLIDPATTPTLSFKRYLRLVGLGNPLRNVNAVRLRQRKTEVTRSAKRTVK